MVGFPVPHVAIAHIRHRFEWRDYTHEHAALISSWLVADAVHTTGMDEGFDDFCRYWEKDLTERNISYL